ncbi:MAG TPA: MBL fold metallo-hydrolase [Mycobacteriales bacterium]|nr:MBL fold metallo-hydrolase [Mycobacteriales bacterium]
MRELAIELAPGVYRIPTAPADLINSYAFVEADGAVTLVDTGLKRASRRIAAGLAAIGRSLADVRQVVLTHSHFDHAGGLAGVLRGGAGAVVVHERDATYLRTGRPPALDASTRRGRILNRLPRGGFEATEVTREIADGELLDVAGGLRVVHTPGHTPGHVSLLHEPTGILITGDAVFNVRGLRYSPAAFCTDVALSRDSADRLADLAFDLVAFTHGAEIRHGARTALQAFLGGRPR